MIDMRLQPSYLPQVTMPYNIALEKLSDEGVEYNYETLDPEELDPIQGITFSDFMTHDIDKKDDFIWVSNDNRVLDGHHRWNKALNYSKPSINIIRINLNSKDASRVLNKIQDIYEYEEKLSSESNIKDYDENEKKIKYDFLDELLTDNNFTTTKNNKKIIAYRKDDINENSVVGNFFTINPTKGYNKYEIDFDNLLIVDDMGVKILDSQNPIDILIKIWFPNVNFEEKSKEYNTTSDNLKTKAIAEKAKKMGYDGIQYNNNLIQGLK